MTEEKKKEKEKISSSGPEKATPAKPRGGADAKAAGGEKKISSSGPEQGGSTKPRGGSEAAASAEPAPSKNPPAAAKAAAPKQKSSGTLRIRQVKSGICAPVDQKQTLFGLGLRRIRQEVVRPDTPAVRGQVHKIRHLVTIVEGA